MDYLIKASAVLLIFYGCYRLFLQRDTFFQANRWFLLIGLIVASCIPLIVIPIYIEYIPASTSDLVYQLNYDSPKISGASVVEPFPWEQILFSTYALGVLFFFGKLGVELLSLRKVLKSCEQTATGDFILLETQNNVAPFSFFNRIVYNPNQFTTEELAHVINHEKIHVKQYHSIDTIIAQLSCILFWFNPIVWFYKKALQQNLEFIADQHAQNVSKCEKIYQQVLLKASIKNHQLAFTNNFYNSLIKKRIVMLHKSKSNTLNLWKYGLILPILALFLMSFNTKEVYIEKSIPIEESQSIDTSSTSEDFNPYIDDLEIQESEDQTPTLQLSQNQTKANIGAPLAALVQKKTGQRKAVVGHDEMVIITKDLKEADFNALKKQLKDKGISVKFKGVKRNKTGEITAIKIEVETENSNSNYHTNSDDPIAPIKISFSEDGNNISIGNGKKHGKNTFAFRTEDDDHHIHKSGSGSNIFVISEDHEEEDENEFKEDNDAKIFIKRHGKNGSEGKTRRVKRTKNVHVITDDDNANDVQIFMEGDDENEDDEPTFIIKKSKGNSIWTDDEDTTIQLKSTDKNRSLFISDDANDNPLFIIDGKEVPKGKISELLPDNIASIDVLKGKSATDLYGDKGKAGVVIITTKKD